MDNNKPTIGTEPLASAGMTYEFPGYWCKTLQDGSELVVDLEDGNELDSLSDANAPATVVHRQMPGFTHIRETRFTNLKDAIRYVARFGGATLDKDRDQSV